MLTTYLADLHPLEDPDVYKKYYQTSPIWRKEKVDRMTPLQNKIQSVGAWSLFSAVATSKVSEADYNKISESRDNFLKTTWVNISHSGSYALCSISNDPTAKVGCDIEIIGNFRESVARRYFCESEYQHLMDIQDQTEQTKLFYRYWVLKEGFLKVTRQGTKLDTRIFEIGWQETKSRIHCHKPYLLRQPTDFTEVYYYQEYFLDDAAIAICTTDAEIDPTLHILHL